jgi:hypothetical protein
MEDLLPTEIIEKRIYVFRGQKVIVDRDLAELYGVKIRTLNQAVRRNIERFPNDFCFQLTREEWESLRSQIVILKSGRGGKGFYPLVFTEPGIAMLSSVLKKQTGYRGQYSNHTYLHLPQKYSNQTFRSSSSCRLPRKTLRRTVQNRI